MEKVPVKLALVVLATVGQGSPAPADTQLRAGEYDRLEIDADVKSIQVNAPDVVSIDLEGRRIVKVIGKVPGGATIRMLDKQHRLLWEGSVQVSPKLR